MTLHHHRLFGVRNADLLLLRRSLFLLRSLQHHRSHENHRRSHCRCWSGRCGVLEGLFEVFSWSEAASLVSSALNFAFVVQDRDASKLTSLSFPPRAFFHQLVATRVSFTSRMIFPSLTRLLTRSPLPSSLAETTTSPNSLLSTT